MDSNKSQFVCFLEKPGCDSVVPSRRKRRKIRLLRKVSCNFASNKGSSVNQHGVHKKRTGSAYRCNALYLLDDGILPKEYCLGDIVRKNSERAEFCRIAAKGLVRSRSFPPEGWKTSQCILQISRIGRLSEEGKLKRSIFSPTEKSQILGSRSLGVDGRDALSVQLSDIVDTPPLSTDMSPQKRSQEHTVASSHGDSDGGVSSGNQQVVQEADTETKAKPPEHANLASADVVSDGLPSSKEVLSQKIEDKCMNSMPKVVSKGNQVKGLTDCNRSSPPSGKVLLCGRRREMEDAAVIGSSFIQLAKSDIITGSHDASSCSLHFYAVYDGHGGSQASTYCAERLHHALAEEVMAYSMNGCGIGLKEWRSAMVSCFDKVDREVGGVCPHGVCDTVDSAAVCCSGTIAPENVGTTAVVAVVSTSQIVVANCGDSRAVLSTGGNAIPLSQDHKPERDDETRRIEAAGGHVIPWKGYRVGALLALSRAIGDRYLKRYVISEPDVVSYERTEQDECLILASDGLWDVIDNTTACDVVRKCLTSAHGRERSTTLRGEDLASATAAATLVKLAYGKGSQDNITVVVVDLSCR